LPSACLHFAVRQCGRSFAAASSRASASAVLAQKLQQDLDAIAADLQPAEEKAAIVGSQLRKSRRRNSKRVDRQLENHEDHTETCVPPAASVTSLVRAAPPTCPAVGMLERQLEAYGQRLLEYRKLIWLREQRELTKKLAEAKEPPAEAPVRVEDLPPKVVQGIFDTMAIDNRAELIERRDARVRNTLAIHLEQMLACDPPAGLQLDGHQVKITEVVAHTANRGNIGRGPVAVPAALAVVFKPSDLSGLSSEELQRRLNASSAALSRCLARRHLLGIAPVLRFEVDKDAGESAPATRTSRSSLWHVAKRQRRLDVHSSMRSWTADLHW